MIKKNSAPYARGLFIRTQNLPRAVGELRYLSIEKIAAGTFPAAFL